MIEIHTSYVEGAIWSPQEGGQTELMRRREFELFFGGEKYSGKSYGAIGWLAKGNPWELARCQANREEPRPADRSYILHPYFRAQVLRKNLDDLRAWFDRAKPIYEALGARAYKSPWEFVWDNGAKIVLGHLADDDAYQKYSGHPIQRLFIDEVTYIPSYRLYEKIRSCVRSDQPEMLPQILLTANPEGPGLGWVKDRFVKVHNPQTGEIIPPLTTMGERSFNPVLNREVTITRVFIPGKILDNKIGLAADPLYWTRLDLLSEPERQAYLFGNWDAYQGSYFTTFRPNGPLGANEPAHARHVVPSYDIRPWYPRIVGFDWGYAHHSVAIKGVLTPDGQLVIIDELHGKGKDAEEWGADIAMWCMDDLRGMENKAITVFMSPEEFGSKAERRSRAQQMLDGINQMLGPNASVIVGRDDLPEGVSGMSLTSRYDLQRSARIVLTPAQNQRVAGWQFVRGLMRFRGLQERPPEIDLDHARWLWINEGRIAYENYINTVRSYKGEVLPKLLLLSKCINTRAAIESAVYDNTETGNPEDVLKMETLEDDYLDSLRYLCLGYRSVVEVEPLGEYVRRRAQEGDLNSLPDWRRQEIFEQDWASLYGRSSQPFSVGRGAFQGRIQ